MFYGKFDSYYYSRPVAYKSYNIRTEKADFLKQQDKQAQQLVNFLRRNSIEYQNLGGLSRGIKFFDIEVGKRTFNHHATQPEYYLRQWKETNDLSRYHPTGTHVVLRNFGDLMVKIEKIIKERKGFK